MNIQEYEKQFDAIINGEIIEDPYHDPVFINYVKLNQKRIKRWHKIGTLLPEVKNALEKISEEQTWVLITEPWCGDAAHAEPFIKKMVLTNPKIKLEIQNRDNGSEIDNYLTNGGKSVPKLIVRDKNGNDLFTWGPRPNEAHNIFLELKNNDQLSFEDKKAVLQSWYNKDKGQSTQSEILAKLNENF